MEQRIVVVGAGPAGVEAALTAGRLGARVTLVHDSRLGGRALAGSLVPSKVWLAEARPGVAPREVLARLAAVQASVTTTLERELDLARVERLLGRARIVGPRAVAREGFPTPLVGDAVILATGSEPTFAPGFEPDGLRVLAPRHLAALESTPRRVAVLGGGATGVEAVQLFGALGAEVHWLPGRSRPLRELAAEAVEPLLSAFRARGVHTYAGQRAARLVRHDGAPLELSAADGRRVEVDLVFVATGRRVDRAGQGLAAAGVADDVVVPPTGCVAPGLYLVGDVAGEPFLANRAAAQGRVAALHALGLAVTPRYDTVVHAVYSDPEVAQVGTVAGPGLRVYEAPFDLALRAHLGRPSGRFGLAVDAAGVLRGGWAVGRHASEALAPVATALAMRGTLAALAEVWPANPTLGELAPLVARRVEGGPARAHA